MFLDPLRALSVPLCVRGKQILERCGHSAAANYYNKLKNFLNFFLQIFIKKFKTLPLIWRGFFTQVLQSNGLLDYFCFFCLVNCHRLTNKHISLLEQIKQSYMHSILTQTIKNHSCFCLLHPLMSGMHARRSAHPPIDAPMLKEHNGCLRIPKSPIHGEVRAVWSWQGHLAQFEFERVGKMGCRWWESPKPHPINCMAFWRAEKLTKLFLPCLR